MASNTHIAALLSLVVASANVVPGFNGTQWFVAENETAAAISNSPGDADRALAAATMARNVMRQVAAVQSLPIRIFAVRNEDSLRELVPQYWDRRGVRPQAASYAGPHVGFIAVRADLPASLQFPLVMHEYVHLLTTADVPGAPAWLDEGLSEFWSAVTIDGGRAVVGRASERHLKQLRAGRWLTMEDMRQHQRGKLDADRARTGLFYAQSWAMVHYLLLGQHQDVPIRFAPAERQWTPQLDAAVRAYVDEGRFREISIPIPTVTVVPGFSRNEPSPISESRALAERANMLVFGERPDAALPLARQALLLNSREPLALEVIGTHYFLSNQPDEARGWLEQALDADPGSHRAALYLSLLSASAADRERFLQLAVTAKPDLVVAWQRLWSLYEEDGRLEQARRWCRRLATLVPLMTVAPPMACDGRGVR